VIGAPIFLYGTLLDASVLARRSGDPGLARRAVPARLAGHARVTLRGTPYPTLVPDARGVVDGVLVRPTPRALAALAAYEGASYRLVPVRVTTPRGACRARAWMAPRWRADRRRAWDPAPRSSP